MKPSTNASSAAPVRAEQKSQGRIKLIATVLLIAALGAGAFQFYRTAHPRQAAAAKEPSTLSASTGAVLNRLKSPIEIRFYSLLDPGSTSESTRAFAERVSKLLDEYERASSGKIHVIRFNEINDANSKAAAADGVLGFNRDKGDTCFFGITAARGGEKETIAELSPDWEQALEPDLSRAVERVNEMRPPDATPANVSDSELAAAQKAIDANPNLASATLEQGNQILRDEALAEFKAAVADMQNQIAAVENQVKQGAVAPADAAKKIAEIRATQTAKIQEISGRFHDQTAAFAQSKAQ